MLFVLPLFLQHWKRSSLQMRTQGHSLSRGTNYDLSFHHHADELEEGKTEWERPRETRPRVRQRETRTETQRQTDRQTDRLTDWLTDKRTDRQADGELWDGQRQTDGTSRQGTLQRKYCRSTEIPTALHSSRRMSVSYQLSSRWDETVAWFSGSKTSVAPILHALVGFLPLKIEN